MASAFQKKLSRVLLRAALPAMTIWVLGCARPPEAESSLVGRWRGEVTSFTTRSEVQHFEDFTLTILPGGRFATLGLADVRSACAAGQVVSGRDGRPAARVVSAEHRAEESRLAVEFLGLADEAGGPVVSGGATTARLRPDGLLDYEFFGYAMSPGQLDRSEGLHQQAVLRRIPAPAGPTSRPERAK
jgi:hypothetical protein